MIHRHGMQRLRPTAISQILLTLFACCTVPSFAAPPDSGSLLQQNQQSRPAIAPGSDTGLKIDRPIGSNLPDSAPFLIKKLDISGNTLYDNATLHALVADLEGSERSLAQLNAAINRISDYYHEHGYPLARAYVPAQTIQDGVINIIIIEARYGQIHLDNSSRVDDSVIESTLAPLQPQDKVQQALLDRTLLLLSDLPGVSSSATLQPGQAVGTSDLLVVTTATPEWTANTLLDNDGNAYTGRARLSGTLNWIDPLQHGDYLSANLLCAGRNMDSASLTYDALLSGSGARLGGMAAYLHYRLGGDLEKLAGHGTATTDSLWLKYPWNRSMEINVSTQLQLDYKNLNDDIDSTGIRTNRHTQAASLTFNGEVNDTVLAGAQTLWSMGWKGGEVTFDDANAQALDQKNADVEGGFVKFNASYSRLQNLTPDTALYLALSAQWANGNLDSSEKMVAGGAYSVRAFDMGVLSGDSGLFGSVELRQLLGNGWGGAWQAIAFLDSQHIRINQNPWTSGSNNSYSTNGANLMGAGLGLNWANDSGWHLKMTVAAPSGSVPELISTKKTTRGWAELGAWF